MMGKQGRGSFSSGKAGSSTGVKKKMVIKPFKVGLIVHVEPPVKQHGNGNCLLFFALLTWAALHVPYAETGELSCKMRPFQACPPSAGGGGTRVRIKSWGSIAKEHELQTRDGFLCTRDGKHCLCQFQTAG